MRFKRPRDGASLLALLLLIPAGATAQNAAVAAPALAVGRPLTAETAVILDEEAQPFKLRHVFHHGAHRHPRLHRRRDVVADANVFFAADEESPQAPMPALSLRSAPVDIERLADRRPEVADELVAMARQHGMLAATLGADSWTVDSIAGPNVTDKDTVLSLAAMCANAYVTDESGTEWLDVGGPWNKSLGLGWESDGLRGHVYSDVHNSTVVIALKGTSMAVFDGEGTTTKDKINDNLLFSCCCGQQGQWSWRQVCDCATGTYSCNNTCVAESLRSEDHYYMAARELYTNVTALYPKADIWLTGHSLGGAIASLVGMTYGRPVVTFEAPPEALAASRIGLPVPPGSDPRVPQARANTAVWHIGHTADPIYIGTCNGATATCSYAGYAMESACHTALECVYDVVKDKGWRVGIGTHRIRAVISDIITQYDEVPKCVGTPECRDCAQWKMYESHRNDTITTTSTSPTSTSTSRHITLTRTRTQTCETPGWWGCLDKSTSLPTTTSTTSTSTCKTPGWFGCNDPVTTTFTTGTETSTTTTTSTTVSTTSTTSTTTTSCETPGWFGCNDPTTSTTSTTTTSCETPGWFGCNDSTTSPEPTSTCLTPGWLGCKDKPTTTETTTSSCSTPGRFWGCYDTSTDDVPPPKPTSTEATRRFSHFCVRRNWYFTCARWEAREEGWGLEREI